MAYPSSLYEQKSTLRAALRARRHEMGHLSLAIAMAAVFQQKIKISPGAIIAGYTAIRSEMDPAPLLDALHRQGHIIALPVVTERGQPLIFRTYDPTLPFIQNSMGIGEPDKGQREVEPDLLLIPLLAFDGLRRRLGYGGGYYDRTITHLRTCKNITAIGLAYEFQRVDVVPTEPHDIALDHIVTEVNVF